ncbi:TPA: hypothetical protein DEP21_03135 [Patescibacteria group bacterium]|nr:hypothetical protein [Candidatus Gracilibacteria bacterium]
MENFEKFEVKLVAIKKPIVPPGKLPLDTPIDKLLEYYTNQPSMSKKELITFLKRVVLIIEPQVSCFMPIATLDKMCAFIRLVDASYKKHTGKLTHLLDNARKSCDRSILSWSGLYPAESLMTNHLMDLALTESTQQMLWAKFNGVPTPTKKKGFFSSCTFA